MVMLIVSIIYWCLPDKTELGVAAIILSAIGTFVDFLFFGWASIIDAIILIINILVFYEKENSHLK